MQKLANEETNFTHIGGTEHFLKQQEFGQEKNSPASQPAIVNGHFWPLQQKKLMLSEFFRPPTGRSLMVVSFAVFPSVFCLFYQDMCIWGGIRIGDPSEVGLHCGW